MLCHGLLAVVYQQTFFHTQFVTSHEWCCLWSREHLHETSWLSNSVDDVLGTFLNINEQLQKVLHMPVFPSIFVDLRWAGDYLLYLRQNDWLRGTEGGRSAEFGEQ